MLIARNHESEYDDPAFLAKIEVFFYENWANDNNGFDGGFTLYDASLGGWG